MLHHLSSIKTFDHHNNLFNYNNRYGKDLEINKINLNQSTMTINQLFIWDMAKIEK